VAEAEGASGGMAIMWDPRKWNKEMNLNIRRIITIKFIEIGTQYQGYLSNVYGPLSP